MISGGAGVAVSSPNSLKLHRLDKPAQFEQIATKGKKVVAGSLVFKHVASPDGAIRLAFVVRKKCGNAVFRNRVRRILRHQFYASFSAVKEPRWCMLQYLGKSQDFKSAALHTEASEIIRKMGWVS